MPKVSIVVPCYGVEKYLDRCVNSLVNQTLRDIEIILVDDESPDRVPEMCDQWAEKDTRIKVIHKKNAGLGMACNSGIEVATAEFIAFCDSDDWVELDMYESMYSAAKLYSADIVFSGLQRIDDSGGITQLSFIDSLEIKTIKEEIQSVGFDMIASSPSERVERRIPMSAKIVLYKLHNILEHNLRFESERRMISEDLLWNLDNIAFANAIVILPNKFYYYFDNSNSLTNSIRSDRFPMYKSLYLELLRRTRILGYSEDIKVRIDRMFLGYARHRVVLLCKSKINTKDKKLQLDEVCSDKELLRVLNDYPTKRMPFVHRIVAYLMKRKAYLLLEIALR